MLPLPLLSSPKRHTPSFFVSAEGQTHLKRICLSQEAESQDSHQPPKHIQQTKSQTHEKEKSKENRQGNASSPQQTAPLSPHHQFLLFIQPKIDYQLDFLRLFRRRPLQSFTNIRHNLISSSKCYIQPYHLDQLLRIDPTLYTILPNTLTIGLPKAYDLPSRKASFKQHLLQYIAKSPIIPQHRHPTTTHMQTAHTLQAPPVQDRLDPFTILTTKSEEFKKRLVDLVREREEKMRKEKEWYISKKYNREEKNSMLVDIHLAFMACNVTSMFMTTLVDLLQKKLQQSSGDIISILQEIVQKCGQYIKKITHSKGIIVQITKKNFMAAKEQLMRETTEVA